MFSQLTVSYQLSNVHSIYYNYIVILVCLASYIIGAFITGVVPLGIDQAIGGSAANNISAFILWFIWAIFVDCNLLNSVSGILYQCARVTRYCCSYGVSVVGSPPIFWSDTRFLIQPQTSQRASHCQSGHSLSTKS